MKPKWIIYYDNGFTYSSLDGEWNDAPTDGVLFVLEFQDGRVVPHSGSDHYVLIDDTVASTMDIGPLLRKWGVKFGRWTSHKVYEVVAKRVAEDAKKWQR